MEYQDMGLLAHLDALLQEGSVTGAARRMGLSTPAMSHALARLRTQLGDPLLVRAGRGMLLSERALTLKPLVHRVVNDARTALSPERPFVPSQLTRTFVIHASDYVLTMLGGEVDRVLQEEAPGVCLRFVPNSGDDPSALRDHGSDLAVGIYGELPPEMRRRQLLTDRFVCVVRSGHAAAAGRLTLEQYLAHAHVQVAPRGRPGGYVDDVLAERGLSRRVARAVPYFLTALQLVAQTAYVLTVSERIALRYAGPLGLAVLDVPFKLRPYALSLLWHPRVDSDPGQHFVREVFVRAARTVAGDKHAEARTRLESEPAAARRRRRS